MDNKEALEIIRKRIDELADVRAFYDSQSEAYKMITLEIRALLKASEALERQIPQRPERIRFAGSQYTDKFTGRCPACGREADSRYKFCLNCGQTLKWEREGA